MHSGHNSLKNGLLGRIIRVDWIDARSVTICFSGHSHEYPPVSSEDLRVILATPVAATRSHSVALQQM